MDEHSFQFQLNETPPFFKSLAYGLQWVMVAIPNIIVFAGLGSAALQLEPAAQISFSQRLLLVTGLMTLIQSLKGHRFPILEGPSSALTLTFIILAPEGLATIEGGMIIGALLLMAIGAFRWFKWLSVLFTPNVIGVILILVAMTILPFLIPMLIGATKTFPYGELGVWGSSLLIILFVSFLSNWLRGFLQTTAMLAGIILGLLLFLAQGRISLTLLSEASWFALPSPLFGQSPSFSLSSILSFLVTYLAVMINTVGSIQGVSEMVTREGLESRIHRGIAFTGLSGIASALFGVMGTVSYAISPGVILVSRVASRYVLTVSGAIMIFSAFVPKLWAFFTAIPASVIASVLFVALASQLMAGMNTMMTGKRRMERREYFTVGIPILLGSLVSILPKPFLHLFPNSIASFVGNGLVVGILFSLLFEHLLFRPKREKQ
ncbi:MAG: purine/pyrimidine permease [Syntrophaceae bacterium]|nr:purine/pyrimidine permease [Syntrophaceae bacterium]